ncbi:hypothetical protein AAG906_004416 [Vitis piasezkii]
MSVLSGVGRFFFLLRSYCQMLSEQSHPMSNFQDTAKHPTLVIPPPKATTQMQWFKLMNKIHTSSIPKQRKGNWTNLGGDSTFSAELHSLCSAAQSLASKYAVWEKCLPKDCLQSYMLLIIRFGLDLQRWDFVEFDDFLVRFGCLKMSEDFLEFLRNKFIDGLAEAEDQGRQLPMHRQFQGIRGVLLRKDITSSTPIQMIQMRNTLYRLLAVYTDCLIFSDKHPIQRTKFLLPFYNLFHFLFLKRTKEVLVRIKESLDQESQSHDPENQSQGPEIWYPHVSEIRGFDRQFSKIQNWLMQSDEGFKDIAIVGIGGSSKTALARQLFYDEHIQGAFFPTLWISLSGKIDAGIDFKQVVEDMLVELTTEHGHEKLRSCSTEELLSSLGRQLLGKKYLIVLDGIWDETRDWYFRLGQALNWPDKDCNIQFGRDQKRNGNAYLHSIEGIGEDEIWSMFNDAADKSKLNPQQNDKLKKLQNEIVKLCDGFPLGVKTLAEIIPGTLATDPSSVNAEPERDTLTQIITIIPMEVQIDGGVAGRLGSKQSWAKKRREPNFISLSSTTNKPVSRFTSANRTGKLVIRTEILTMNGP